MASPWVRAWLSVDPLRADAIYQQAPPGQGQKAVERMVVGAAAEAGLIQAQAAMQDPSDPSVFTIIARNTTPRDPALRRDFVLSTEPVSPPPSSPRAPDLPDRDAGLLDSEVWVAQVLLANERDPRRLEGAAGTYLGDFPVLACLLMGKAVLEERMRAARGVTTPAQRIQGARDAQALADASSRLVPAKVWEAYLPALAENALPNLSPGPVPTAPDPAAAVALGALSEFPGLADKSIDELAATMGITREAAQAARASISRVGGVVLASPAHTRALLPGGPAPVPHSAIKAAYGILRPVVGQLREPNALASRLEIIHAGAPGSEEAKASAALSRARRLLGRTDWADWLARWHHGYA